MSAMTLLEGPWDSYPTSHKQTVQAKVPPEVFQRVFTNSSPLRGSRDKILARMDYALDEYIKEHDLFPFPQAENEILLNDILNSITINHVPTQSQLSTCGATRPTDNNGCTSSPPSAYEAKGYDPRRA